VIEDICVLESDQAERAGVKLMQEVAAREMLLQADERALKQILFNLLSNSFKFTPAGGMVTCRALFTAAGGISIEVQDTGIGIPEDHLNRVLDPFIQVRDRHARKSAGTGLGLSLVRVLAELHGGRVVVRSQSGRGTAIRVNLPPWRTMTGDPAITPGSLLPNRAH
jgi:two-component system cell cycle sensor histidine kinase PleC